MSGLMVSRGLLQLTVADVHLQLLSAGSRVI